MGGAILAAWIKKGYPLKNIFVEEPNPSEWLINKSNEGLNLNKKDIQEIQYCFIGVKPQNLEKIGSTLKMLSNKSVTFVSMLAGIEIMRISAIVGQQEPIVRIMPNTPAEVFKGVTALVENQFVKARNLEELISLIESFGTVIKLSNEDKLNAVTAISGSGPAYVFLMAELMIREGVKQGLTQEEASHLAKNTILGAGELMTKSDINPSKLRKNVTSPGGTTEAALSHLMAEESGLPYILANAISAAVERSRQLSKV